MTKILLAAYRKFSKRQTVPIISSILAEGGSAAYINYASDKEWIPVEGVPSFSYEATFENDGIITIEESESLLRDLLKPQLNPDRLEATLQLIQRLNPPFTREYPIKLNAWLPKWEAYFNKILDEWQPDKVILANGVPESATVLRVCGSRGIPVLCMLSSFWEFTTKERAYLGEKTPANCKYVTASSVGKRKLQNQGVLLENVEIAGSPAFDYIKKIKPISKKRKRNILYALQDFFRTIQLGKALINYLREREDVTLTIRKHPIVEQIPEIETLVAESGLTDRIKIEEPNTPLAESLNSCSVLVSLNSVTTVEAAILGKPSIVWNPTPFPEGIYTGEDYKPVSVRNYTELRDFLDSHFADEKSKKPQNTKILSLRDNATTTITNIIKLANFDDIGTRNTNP